MICAFLHFLLKNRRDIGTLDAAAMFLLGGLIDWAGIVGVLALLLR